MSLKQKEIKFKPRLKLNNNTHTWGRKFVAPKAAQPKVAVKIVGGGGGGIILKFRVSDFQHFPQHIFSKLI